jgi:hypothetical protein
MKATFVLALLALFALLAWCSVPQEVTRGVVEYESLNEIRIYAYRDWQNTGVRVERDDMVTVEAQGEWTYTPGEVHGPEGHRIYRAPRFYPLPGVPGGVLIGRIGEPGEDGGGNLFQVGKRARWRASREGYLYLRIDDDILSDNVGYVTVHVEVERAEGD